MNRTKHIFLVRALCFIGSLCFQNISAAAEECLHADALFEMIEYYDTEVRPTESPEAICDFCAQISQTIITEKLSRADLDAVRAKVPTYAPYLLDFPNDEVKDACITRMQALIEFYQGSRFDQGSFNIKKYIIIQHQHGYRFFLEISDFHCCLAFDFLMSDYSEQGNTYKLKFIQQKEQSNFLSFIEQLTSNQKTYKKGKKKSPRRKSDR